MGEIAAASYLVLFKSLIAVGINVVLYQVVPITAKCFTHSGDNFKM